MQKQSVDELHSNDEASIGKWIKAQGGAKAMTDKMFNRKVR